MRRNILRLIQDDVKITRLVHTLDNLHINCYDYLLNNSTVIFSLMGITPCEEINEEYYKMIEKASDEDYSTSDKMKDLSMEIYKCLLNYELNAD